MRVWGLCLMVACLISGTAAYAQVPEAYRDGSYYEEVARDVARLNIAPETGRDVGCVNNVFAQNPCPEIVSAWYSFTRKHDLPRNAQTARMLRSYIERDFKTADRIYAQTKGYSLPEELQVPSGVASTVTKLGVRRAEGRDVACSNDPLSAKPCPKAVSAWKAFAREHGLALNAQSARMFEAYVEGRTREADRLFASAKKSKDKEPDNELVAEVRTYGVKRRSGMEVGECENNYYAVNPCLEAVQAWRHFARKHGLDLNKQSADLFEAYIEGNPVQGDKLYAAAKGLSISELLEKRGYENVSASPSNRLYVPIFPPGSGR